MCITYLVVELSVKQGWQSANLGDQLANFLVSLEDGCVQAILQRYKIYFVCRGLDISPTLAVTSVSSHFYDKVEDIC